MLDNILSPPILFFFLGLLAIAVRSDLEIPQPVAKFISLYLLLAIGLRGGVELRHAGLTLQAAGTLGAAMMMAVLTPIVAFFLLRLRVDVYNAAAIAATYGSISAVTFVTATAFLQRQDIVFSGHMVAAMALMESPAIVIGVFLVHIFAPKQGELRARWSELLREAFLNGSVLLIMGSLLIGLLTGARDWDGMRPFSDDIFHGVLAFFLLDMGLVAAKRLSDLRRSGVFLTCFAILAPLVSATAGVALARALGMSRGDALLFVVLCASASYIAVPAAMRLAVPQANPSLYVSMSLGVTFPFNIVIGLPLYLWMVDVLGR
jgi:hypothetical protein